jgi:hypothetical protein
VTARGGGAGAAQPEFPWRRVWYPRGGAVLLDGSAGEPLTAVIKVKRCWYGELLTAALLESRWKRAVDALPSARNRAES